MCICRTDWSSCVSLAAAAFTIRGVSLSIQPASDLLRDANATLWCRAQVSTSGPQALRHAYTFYKDDTVVLTKSSASPELAYPLPRVRYANTGKYKCRVEIEGQGKTSEPRKLRVTGGSLPLLLSEPFTGLPFTGLPLCFRNAPPL